MLLHLNEMHFEFFYNITSLQRVLAITWLSLHVPHTLVSEQNNVHLLQKNRNPLFYSALQRNQNVSPLCWNEFKKRNWIEISMNLVFPAVLQNRTNYPCGISCPKYEKRSIYSNFFGYNKPFQMHKHRTPVHIRWYL